MSNYGKSVEYTEPKTAYGESIFGFDYICGFDSSHDLPMKNNCEKFVPKSSGVIGVKVKVAFHYKCIFL